MFTADSPGVSNAGVLFCAGPPLEVASALTRVQEVVTVTGTAICNRTGV